MSENTTQHLYARMYSRLLFIVAIADVYGCGLDRVKAYHTLRNSIELKNLLC